MSAPHIPAVCHSVPSADRVRFCESAASSCTRRQLVSIQISVSSAVQSSPAVWTEQSNQQAYQVCIWHLLCSLHGTQSVLHRVRLCVCVCVCLSMTAGPRQVREHSHRFKDRNSGIYIHRNIQKQTFKVYIYAFKHCRSLWVSSGLFWCHCVILNNLNSQQSPVHNICLL